MGGLEGFGQEIHTGLPLQPYSNHTSNTSPLHNSVLSGSFETVNAQDSYEAAALHYTFFFPESEGS